MSAGQLPPPLVVGLLGGIGAGKSEVAAMLARRSGGRLIVADTLGHAALRDPALREQLIERFGSGVLDETGAIDRKRLGAAVFGDKQAREYLESLTHPWIRQRAEEEVQRGQNEGALLIVIDAPLLLEAGWDEVCDKLVFVDAPFETRRERVQSKRGWTLDDLQRREAAQLPLTWKQARADHVIENASTQESLTQQVDDLLQRWGLPRRLSSQDPFVASSACAQSGANRVSDVPLRAAEGRSETS